MPLVRVDMLADCPPEVVVELHRRLAELVSEVVGVPIERVRTYITEFPATAWGIGGRTTSPDHARPAEIGQ
jgi:phenylpyruvate tautomerase PptA (4-oxalocrotonate tautomerase family)